MIRMLPKEFSMRISSIFIAMCFLLAFGATLEGQTAVEYGTIAAGTTGATTDSKDVSKSIGGVFGRIGKGMDKLSTGPQGRRSATATSVRKPATSGGNRPVAASSIGRPKAAPIVHPSQIRIGMSRKELLRAVGEPSMQISTTDEGVFSETYMYRGSTDTVTVTLHDGKVTEVSPMPEESVKAPVAEIPPQARSEGARPQ
jgi:hypothetical protein